VTSRGSGRSLKTTVRQQNSWKQLDARRTKMRVGIATDHGGFGLKEELVTQLHAEGHEIVDFGANA
jgi:hypothetical protein